MISLLSAKIGDKLQKQSDKTINKNARVNDHSVLFYIDLIPQTGIDTNETC
jgi:hypothetical protein